jgi:uncharacterized protein (DUF2147 family)
MSINHDRHIEICNGLSVLLIWFSCVFGQSEADSIIGKWYTEGCQAVFDFYRCDSGEYRARLFPLENPELTDKNNPVDSLTTRKLHGITAICGLEYDSAKRRWVNGTIYNPENGKTYSCCCWIKKRGTQMVFRGYIGVSLLGGSQIWSREKCFKKE